MENARPGYKYEQRHEQQQPTQRVMNTVRPSVSSTMLKQSAPGEIWQTLVMNQARSQSGRL